MQQSSNDEQWYEEVTYVSRTFGAWYVVSHAVNHLAHSGLSRQERTRYAKFVSDASLAVEKLTPPPRLGLLHQKFRSTFDRARISIATRPDDVSADILEDIQIAGVAIKQQLGLLGIDYELYN